MPRKNIYIRKEDEPILKEAIEKFGEDKALGVLIMEALEEKLNNLPEIQEKVLKLQMLKQVDIPAFNEIIEYRLQDFNKAVVVKAEYAALAAYLGEPEHFDFNNIEHWMLEWIDAFLWTGIDGLIEEKFFNEWFEEAKQNVEKGMEVLEESEDEKVGDVEDIENLKEEL